MNATIEALERILRPYNMTVDEYLRRLNRLPSPTTPVPISSVAPPYADGGFSWGLASPLFALGGFLALVGCCLYWHNWREKQRLLGQGPHSSNPGSPSHSPARGDREADQGTATDSRERQVTVRSQGCSSVLEMSGRSSQGMLTLVQHSFHAVAHHHLDSTKPLPPITENSSGNNQRRRTRASTLPRCRSAARRTARRQQQEEQRGQPEDRQRMLEDPDALASAIDNHVFVEEVREENLGYINLTIPLPSHAKYPTRHRKPVAFATRSDDADTEAEAESQSEADGRGLDRKRGDGDSLSSTALYPEDHHPTSSRPPQPRHHASDFQRGVLSQSSARSMSTANSETLSLPSSIAKFHASRQRTPQYPPLLEPLVSTLNSQHSLEELCEGSDQYSDDASMLPNVGSASNTQDLGYVLTLNGTGPDPPPRITARHLVEILDSDSPPLQGTPTHSNLSTDDVSDVPESEVGKDQSNSTNPDLKPAPTLVSGGGGGSLGEASDWSTGGTKGSMGSLSHLRPQLVTPPPGDESFCWDDFPFSSDPLTFHRDILSLPQPQELYTETEFQTDLNQDLQQSGISYRQMYNSLPVLSERRHWV